jgi:hypothetical protein
MKLYRGETELHPFIISVLDGDERNRPLHSRRFNYLYPLKRSWVGPRAVWTFSFPVLGVEYLIAQFVA